MTQRRRPKRYRLSVHVARAPQATVISLPVAGGSVWLLWALATAPRPAAAERACLLARARGAALAPRGGRRLRGGRTGGGAAALMGLGWAGIVGSMVGQARQAGRAGPPRVIAITEWTGGTGHNGAGRGHRRERRKSTWPKT